MLILRSDLILSRETRALDITSTFAKNLRGILNHPKNDLKFGQSGFTRKDLPGS